MAQHAAYIAFVFALGACVGSFLNVVVWRLPRVEHPEGDGLLQSFYRSYRALSSPPSHCPKCEKRLLWYDNVPVIGWIKLGGRCRFCKEPISPRYPIVEAISGGIFVLYYVLFFFKNIGPCAPGTVLSVPRDLWMYFLYMALLAALLAASLIDAELFIIPLEIPYFMAVVGFVVHAICDHPGLPGALNVSAPAAGMPAIGASLAAGGFVGLAVSLILFAREIIPMSFPDGEPDLEVERVDVDEDDAGEKRGGKTLEYFAPPEPPPPQYTPKQIRAEIRKEMLFLFPPMAGAVLWLVLTLKVTAIGHWWAGALHHDWLTGLLGSILGALVGAWLVWIVRILGTLGFGRVAMGLGDVHLMLGVGAVIGAGPVVVAFFLAPFFGILLAIYKLLIRSKQELPYGPYLSLGTAAVMLFYCPIADYFRPGLQALMYFLTGNESTGG
jgi:leader peptidase (prepilin peptidase)/N-methyltransferase